MEYSDITHTQYIMLVHFRNWNYRKQLRQDQQPFSQLTLKGRETHGCVVSAVTTDAPVLKHQAISIHNAD